MIHELYYPTIQVERLSRYILHQGKVMDEVRCFEGATAPVQNTLSKDLIMNFI